MSVKKLGFGMMRLPLLNKDDDGSIDIELTKKMVDVFIERGFTYFDTAWMYCDYKSENAVKAAVVDRHPRDSFTLTTKLHNMYVHSFEDRDKIFNEQLRKTGVKAAELVVRLVERGKERGGLDATQTELASVLDLLGPGAPGNRGVICNIASGQKAVEGVLVDLGRGSGIGARRGIGRAAV